jgi:hypothetical protein
MTTILFAGLRRARQQNQILHDTAFLDIGQVEYRLNRLFSSGTYGTSGSWIG